MECFVLRVHGVVMQHASTVVCSVQTANPAGDHSEETDPLYLEFFLIMVRQRDYSPGEFIQFIGVCLQSSHKGTLPGGITDLWYVYSLFRLWLSSLQADFGGDLRPIV